jgi:hypothetical protein
MNKLKNKKFENDKTRKQKLQKKIKNIKLILN